MSRGYLQQSPPIFSVFSVREPDVKFFLWLSARQLTCAWVKHIHATAGEGKEGNQASRRPTHPNPHVPPPPQAAARGGDLLLHEEFHP